MKLKSFNFLTIALIILILYSSHANKVENSSEPIIQLKDGQVKGKVSVDMNGKNFYSFQGIPYAQPPTGDLRFKAPLPVKPWSDIHDATKEGNECLMYSPMTKNAVGLEDCLVLNVYTPELQTGTELKPVMFLIHGGAFTHGSSNTYLYGPEFLITEDVVIVSINYRLGALGFLSLEDTSLGVPGNAGLKDMVLALSWVQKNIEKFNGNPNNVTIIGVSAGSAACHYLMLSQSATGLFHRAILHSGVVLNSWATGDRNAIKVAQVLGNNATNEAEALEYLKSIPAQKILEAQMLFPDNLVVDEQRPFSPVIEKPNLEALLTQHPLDIMESGNYNKVPVIIGYTSSEGMLAEYLQKLNTGTVVYRMPDFQRAIPKYYNLKLDSKLSKIIAQKIKDFYYGNSTTPDDDIKSFDIMNTDLLFVRGIYVTIREFLKTLNQPIYLYRFNLETNLNTLKHFTNVTRSGVSHGDDFGYFFKTVFTPKIEPGSIEDISRQRVLKLWTNFAKTGNPNPKVKDSLIDIEWPPVTSNEIKSLDIDTKFTITTNPEQERMKFWDEISAMKGIDSKL